MLQMLSQISLAATKLGMHSHEDEWMMHKEILLTASEVCQAGFCFGGFIQVEGFTYAGAQMCTALFCWCCCNALGLPNLWPQKHMLAMIDARGKDDRRFLF